MTMNMAALTRCISLTVVLAAIILSAHAQEGEYCEPLSAVAEDDPHLTGFFGQRFEFQGNDSLVFNLLSDFDTQLNARFVSNLVQHSGRKTFISQLGIRVGDTERLNFTCVGRNHFLGVVNDNYTISADEPLFLDGSGSMIVSEPLYKRNNTRLVDNTFLRTVWLQIPGYDVHIWNRKNKASACFLNVRVTLRRYPSETVHGLLGQTLHVANYSAEVSGADAGKYSDGVFSIEGTDEDYQDAAGDIYGTAFAYNRFGIAASSGRRRLQGVDVTDEDAVYGTGVSRELLQTDPADTAVFCDPNAQCLFGNCFCSARFGGNGTFCAPRLVFLASDTVDPIPDSRSEYTTECDAVPLPPSTVNVDTPFCAEGADMTALVEERTNGACDGDYTLVRRWEAVERCSNETFVMERSYTVTDTTGPTLSISPPLSVSLECGLPLPAVNVSTSDACSAPATATETTEMVDIDMCTYDVLRTWASVDDCGNAYGGSSVGQTVRYTDTLPPMFTTTAVDATTQCMSQWPTAASAAVSAVDACGFAVTLSVSETAPVTSPIDGSISANRTFEAVDRCGNVVEMIQRLVALDTTPPSFDVVPPVLIDLAEKSPDCDGSEIVLPHLTGEIHAVDNCDAAPGLEVIWTVTVNTTEVCNYEVQYTVTDFTGNTATFVIQESAVAIAPSAVQVGGTVDDDPWTDAGVSVTAGNGVSRLALHGNSTDASSVLQTAVVDSSALISIDHTGADCDFDVWVSDCTTLTNVVPGTVFSPEDFCHNYYDPLGTCEYNAGTTSCISCTAGAACFCTPMSR